VNERGIADGDVAVSSVYGNLGRERPNGEGLRSMFMLTGKGIRSVPKRVCTAEPDDELLRWAQLQGRNVKFYLYRPPVSPWRALHFKIRWVQEKLTGKKDIPENPSWVLYELSKDSARKVELPAVSDWPRRVPGM
jgi:hypothetical protein